ncbi:hypothetical protein QE381_001234 [Microbacterium sp. SORGH_AS 888]|nr:hypothetical protein [Microbacterium sp. SORGH_AS_0888]
MKGFAASRPCATTSSLGLVAPALMRFQLFSVASASTIMIATSPSSSTRPATMRSKTASSTWAALGKATHWSACSPWPGMSARRTPAIGPEKGRPEIWVDSDAALIASAS